VSALAVYRVDRQMSRRARHFVAAFAGFGVALSLAGCTAPLDQFFTVHFRNNLGREVTFSSCRDDKCQDRYGASRVAPGRTVEDLTSSFGVLNNWRVEDTSGRVIGCLPLKIDGKWRDLVVPFSKVEPCPGRKPLRVADLPHGGPLKDP
jgi:hypothetical protein